MFAWAILFFGGMLCLLLPVMAITISQPHGEDHARRERETAYVLTLLLLGIGLVLASGVAKYLWS